MGSVGVFEPNFDAISRNSDLVYDLIIICIILYANIRNVFIKPKTKIYNSEKFIYNSWKCLRLQLFMTPSISLPLFIAIIIILTFSL